MSDTPNLDELKEHVRKLSLLLKDPHPGLSTWCGFYAEQMQAISKFWNLSDPPKDVSMVVGTHTGKRIPNRGRCEKCGQPTNWVVDVMGRVGAYWCGCGN